MIDKRVLILGNCFGDLAHNTMRIGLVVNQQSKLYTTVINPLDILLDMDWEDRCGDALREIIHTEIHKADLIMVMPCASENEFTKEMVNYATSLFKTYFLK